MRRAEARLIMLRPESPGPAAEPASAPDIDQSITGPRAQLHEAERLDPALLPAASTPQ